jgi:long-subunit acyl-CoA synthetase (AMP-forming)
MGAIAQPLNSAYKKAEFEWYLADTTPRMIIVDSTCILNTGIIDASIALNIPLYLYSCYGVTNAAILSVHLRSNCQMEKTEGAVTAARDEDIALYLHTSGTTSAPKGVPLSHRNLIASIVNISGSCYICSFFIISVDFFFTYALLAVVYVSHVWDRFFNTPRL